MRNGVNWLGAAAIFAASAFGAPCAAAQNLASCHAKGLEKYVGRPVDELRRIRTKNVRYVCSTCAATMDFSAERLTVVYDEATSVTKSLSCN